MSFALPDRRAWSVFITAMALPGCDAPASEKTPVQAAAPVPVVEVPGTEDTKAPTVAQGAPAPEAAGGLKVAVESTAFRITFPDGHVLSDMELVGVVLTVRDEANAWRKVRIEKVEVDPRDADVTLYDVSVQDPQTSAWAPMCGPGPDGLARAMPLAGTWTADGRHEPAGEDAFNVTCTSGAITRCRRSRAHQPAGTRNAFVSHEVRSPSKLSSVVAVMIAMCVPSGLVNTRPRSRSKFQMYGRRRTPGSTCRVG